VTAAANQLVQQRLLLQQDADLTISQANAAAVPRRRRLPFSRKKSRAENAYSAFRQVAHRRYRAGPGCLDPASPRSRDPTIRCAFSAVRLRAR
jgi:hypothetical protein